eukprot:GHVS01106323.1.p1 GENE.GHVS01106323.1~~GHVS01106323.1.p1  ORF type:complete len:262 (+),score=29.04 GHVS01106323.1:1-786(+)
MRMRSAAGAITTSATTSAATTAITSASITSAAITSAAEDDTAAAAAADQRGRPLHDVQHCLSRPSLLSHRMAQQNLKGFYNLVIIVLLATNARLVVENIMKYGVMIQIPRGPHDIVKNWPLLACFITMHLFILGAWIIERYVAVWCQSPINPGVLALQLWNSGLLLVVPCLTVYQFEASPAAAVLLLSFSVVWCFKFLSFHHVCCDVRRALRDGEDMEKVCPNQQEAGRALKYPQSVNLRHFYRFVVMPTMCFQVKSIITC